MVSFRSGRERLGKPEHTIHGGIVVCALLPSVCCLRNGQAADVEDCRSSEARRLRLPDSGEHMYNSSRYATWLVAIILPITLSSARHSPKTSRQKISHFGPAQHSLRLLQETSFDQTLAAVGSTRAGRPPLPFSNPEHQPTTNPGPAPGRAAGPVGLRSTR